MSDDTNWPLRHISLRVPWHDDGWRGVVCKQPELNSSCLRLSRISDHRHNPKKSNQCEHVRGRSLQEIESDNWPCCVQERAMFMSPFEYTRSVTHPYTKSSPETHGHFAPTPLRNPPFSLAAIPFNWMLKNEMEKRRNDFDVDVSDEREPNLGFKTQWVQDRDNQTALLNCFFGHIKPEKSLCFIYAKEVPFIEDSRRVIVGVGRVKHVGEAVEYKYSGHGKLRSILWERMIQHSIRPGFKDGFLMPYYDLIDYINNHQDINPAEFTAFAPTEYFDEFSYASEHVSHDAAIEALENCVGALQRARGILPGNFEYQLKWLQERLSELWKRRGPCPGLGAAFRAFGIEYGAFVAREIETKIGENEDPWPMVEMAFKDPQRVLTKRSAHELGATLRDKWSTLKSERKALLKLLSRFNLQLEQAEYLYVQEVRESKGIRCSDADVLRNPYLIYELTRLTGNPIQIWTVDRGVFPDDVIRNKHPLPEPSAIDTGTDARRVRAFTVYQLENAAEEGHTLQREKDVVLAIRNLDIHPSCLVDNDLMDVVEKTFVGVIDLTDLKDGDPCYQLHRFVEVGEVIRNSINKRKSGIRHIIKENWHALLDKHLSEIISADNEEKLARKEKTAALTELAESRFSILIGPAGTGKTTLLSVLCSHPEIKKGGVLLLAPTGKARVRMEQVAKGTELKLKGYTIAQFLSKCDRYDAKTGGYHLSNAPKETPAKTVIVDECSMLTEEMLAALLDALSGVERLILVGDPRQLPPIGAGRPFVDIVAEMAPQNVHSIFPKSGPGYAELTIQRRQGGSARDDVRLAEWFRGAPMEPGEDEILEKILSGETSLNIAFKKWDTPEQFRNILFETIQRELSLASSKDIDGFDRSLGGMESKGYYYFNLGCAKAVENWQILSPVRKLTHGVSAINRMIHEQYRAKKIEFARRRKYRKVPKPMGLEQIVYGDKVINIVNRSRNKVYPKQDAECYIANGEIGVIVGQFHRKNMKSPPWSLEIEFSSQQGFKYGFNKNEFAEEAAPHLELAYALTIHKAQGSEFGKVILSLPNPCRLLSRELLYTALTRQRERIVILHQGSISDIRKYSSHEFSETARRLTNLFHKPSLVEHNNRFYEEKLIHRTLRGEMVRSKSEVIIANLLHNNRIDYVYEKPLVLNERTRYPDFTIEEAETGRKFYWEHCGMIIDPEYKKRWEKKLKWYRVNGILPFEEGGGSNGTLVITKETEEGGISSQEIDDIIKRHLVN